MTAPVRTRARCTLLALLALAAAAPRPAAALKVAVFDDPGFVDTDGSAGAESDTVQASLAQLGHTVRPFAGTSHESIVTALEGQDVLLVPELEVDDLAAALSPAARAAIADFVAGGGGFVLHGAYGGSADADLLAAVFDVAVSAQTVGSAFTRQAAAAGTRFATTPDGLPANDGSNELALPLPAGARAVYASPTGAGVALFRHGFGQIAYLGWDWFEAAPLGTQDAGWLAVLDAAVRQVADRCGNGALDPGERCDDGNVADGDCCASACTFEPVGSVCGSDGDADACTALVCDGGGVCAAGSPCDDGDPCTDDGCTGDAECSHTANVAPCDDGDPCTANDVCANGTCAGAAGCDDGNSCTDDVCVPGLGCEHAVRPDAASCDNADGCGPDTCGGGQCKNPGPCASTTVDQLSNNKLRMEWAPAVAAPGDFCVGQAFIVVDVQVPGAGPQTVEFPATNRVQRSVSERTGRAVLPLRLTKRGRRALRQAAGEGRPLRVVVRMDVHARGNQSQIVIERLLQRFRRR